MRHAGFISILTLLPATVILANNMTDTGEIPTKPPAHKMLRFDEDYSYLSNAPSWKDWFDAARYIPLGTNDPSWFLSFGGELRERVESIHDDNFGIGSGADSFWLQRITFLADLHL